jgi:integrase
VRTGVTFADAAADWLRYVEVDRERKRSTVAGYEVIVRAQLLPAFGETPMESITTSMIERWLASLNGAASSRTKALVLLHGILKRAKKVWALQSNPAAEVEKPPLRRSGEIQVYTPEEVWALVRAASSEQDTAIYLTAAFTGLRLGELLALGWRDVDFAGSVIRVRASYAAGALTTPKSGKVRSVPMAPDVATALAQLGVEALTRMPYESYAAAHTGARYWAGARAELVAVAPSRCTTAACARCRTERPAQR